MTGPTQLSTWLPLLTHPEHGEAICKAAGCHIGKVLGFASVIWALDEHWPISRAGNCELSTSRLASLAFGTLAVLADSDNGGDSFEIERVKGVWYVEKSRNGALVSTDSFCADTLPATVLAATVLAAAVLAAAYRWLGIAAPDATESAD